MFIIRLQQMVKVALVHFWWDVPFLKAYESGVPLLFYTPTLFLISICLPIHDAVIYF
jgi:hypothetical protein